MTPNRCESMLFATLPLRTMFESAWACHILIAALACKCNSDWLNQHAILVYIRVKVL